MVSTLLQLLQLLQLLRGALLAWLLAMPLTAAGEDAQALDQDLQQFRKDMLDVNKRLLIMEEELLFPANAQLTLFVSLDVGRFLRLDSLTIDLDGKPVQSHLYTEREVSALKRGAIQRALTTIVKPGKHQLTVVISGTDGHDRSVRRAATIEFEKDDGQKYLRLRIVDNESAMQADLAFDTP